MFRNGLIAIRFVATTLLVTAPVTSFCENLNMHLELNPQLVEGLSAPGGPVMHTESDPPTYNLTRIVVEGESPENWVEAIEIVSTAIQLLPENVKAWYEDFYARGEAVCQDEWTILDEDKRSILFERKSPPCNDQVAQHALYRVLYGELNVFTVIATRKGVMNDETRDAWLAVLGSAAVQ